MQLVEAALYLVIMDLPRLVGLKRRSPTEIACDVPDDAKSDAKWVGSLRCSPFAGI